MKPLSLNSKSDGFVIDILLSTYNGSEFLEELIDSILNQSIKHWRLLVRDDGSSDQTANIILKYAANYSNKIIFIKDSERLGVVKSFSKLMGFSRSRYLMFCDQDDIWLPNKVEMTYSKMVELENKFPNQILLVHTDLTVVNQRKEIISDSFWQYQHLNPQCYSMNYLLVQNIVTGCTVMINKQLKQLAYPIPENVIMHDWWLALLASSSNGVHSIDTATILYRQHAMNSVGAHKYKLSTFIRRIRSAKSSIHNLIVQARTLYFLHGNKIDKANLKMLERFGLLLTLSRMERLTFLKKYSIQKQGKLRQIGFIMLMLILSKKGKRSK